MSTNTGVIKYIEWVQEVNLEAKSLGKCLSCFNLNSDTLSEYFKEGISPKFAVIKLAVDKRERQKCLCEERGLKS